MNKKYIVTLTDEERQILKKLISTGKTSARKLKGCYLVTSFACTDFVESRQQRDRRQLV